MRTQKCKPLKWKANDKALQQFTTFFYYSQALAGFISISWLVIGILCECVLLLLQRHFFRRMCACVCVWKRKRKVSGAREERANEFAYLALHYRSIIVLRVWHTPFYLTTLLLITISYNIFRYCYIENRRQQHWQWHQLHHFLHPDFKISISKPLIIWDSHYNILAILTATSTQFSNDANNLPVTWLKCSTILHFPTGVPE